ncbi:MAG: hypothetical protein SF339_11935 [Blastocatellia bacterium]|nr:hypothetical protein [Blastocatellia bacterium]
MALRSLAAIILVVGLLTVTWARGAATVQQPPTEEQNETMLDTLKRMQIKREEMEHKKLLDKGHQITQAAEELTKAATGKVLPRTSEKRLREIEKSARQIRSEFGGGGGNDEDPLESPPATLEEALKRLNDQGEKLNKEMGKTSRRVISFTVIEIATEIVQLIRLLRGYLG